MLSNSPKIVTDGLVLYFDTSNTKKSWLGMPTTNLSAGYAISAYLNVPSDVTSVITLTGENYLGSPVYKQVLTPITSTGVSYLTNANNPGIGAYTSGGGGLANRWTGHSIFYKPTVPMNATPIFTNYSNIGGWQSSTNRTDMGDGWFRATVMWVSTSTLSDGKYWAINPLNATLNNPITIYWAGPFKEDNNSSDSYISPYTPSSRSTTNNLIDLTGNNTITANSLAYNSDGTFTFAGGVNYLSVASALSAAVNEVTLIAVVNLLTEAGPHQTAICTDLNYQRGIKLMAAYHAWGPAVWVGNSDGTGNYLLPSGVDIQNAGWKIIACSRSSTGLLKIYINGVLITSSSSGFTGSMYTPDTTSARVGVEYHSSSYGFNGKIPISMAYNRLLTDAEVAQNFDALRGRYGL